MNRMMEGRERQESEKRRGKEGMKLRSERGWVREKGAFRRSRLCYAAANPSEAAKDSGTRDLRDRELRRGWGAPVASQAIGKREPTMRSLRAGDDLRRRARWRRERGITLNLQALGAHQLDADPPIESAAPVSPEDWGGSDGQGMEQETDLARLCGVTALPLTLGA